MQYACLTLCPVDFLACICRRAPTVNKTTNTCHRSNSLPDYRQHLIYCCSEGTQNAQDHCPTLVKFN